MSDPDRPSPSHVFVWSPPRREPYLTVFCERCGHIRRWALPLSLEALSQHSASFEDKHRACPPDGFGPVCHKCLCWHEGPCPVLPE